MTKKGAMEKEITFEISLKEANLIFQSLSERPFKEVYELIGKLNEQVNAQVSKKSNSSAEEQIQKLLNED